jgi:uncharacterized protein involved in exopolysaccharide biosynthesis
VEPSALSALLARWRSNLNARDVIVSALVGAALSALLLLLWPAKYDATAVLLLDSPKDMVGGIDIGALSDLVPAGALGLGSGKESGYSYLQVCESFTLLSHVLDGPDPIVPSSTLFARYGGTTGSTARRREDAVDALRKAISAAYDPKSNFCRVTARTAHPALSAYIANSVVSEIRRFDQFTRSTRARDAVEFVKARLAEAKTNLANCEAQLAAFQEANARIGNAPRLQLQLKRLERDVVEAEGLYSLLSRQYELAQIQEKKEAPVFSVVDAAEVPTRPARLSIILVAALSALFCGTTALLLGVAVRRNNRRLGG